MIALVAAPLAAWLAICACQALGNRGLARPAGWAQRLAEMPMPAEAALVSAYVGGIVHAVLVQPHWAEDRTRAVLFILDTLGFAVAFGWTFMQRRGWRTVSLLMAAATVGGYAYYVLKGLEGVDLVGLITTTVELAAALVLVVPAQAQAPATQSRRRERWVAGLAVPLAMLSVLGANAIATAGSAAAPQAGAHHAVDVSGANLGAGDGMATMPGMGGGSARGTRRLSLATTSPAGPIVWPVSMAAMAPGMKMATGMCMTPPTASQQRAAVSLVNRTVAATAPYKSLAAAKAAGYVPVTPTGLKVVHYINLSTYEQGSVLDPAKVPVLVYINTDHGAVLSAAMYLLPGSAARQPPQPGGCLTQWHLHTNLCFASSGVVGTTSGGACPAGSINRVTPPMMHVWLTPVPGGPLAPDPSALAELVAAAKVPALKTPNGTA